ncbi:EAL domain-containing protein [Actinotalea sp.]|uniref:putative bifunctional diguanylate cyclase/phosphodiesterase n=1 Tax=Actinotalea sp. TaxID=1872145 RepID=UPI002BD62EE9|nr:EAL domain-containing protein [Actinotalea sp.]HRA50851.1 EAL domain-containing protein [Actinotalea sp.]
MAAEELDGGGWQPRGDVDRPTGVPERLQVFEPLACLALAGHGLAVQAVAADGWLSFATGSTALLVVLGVAGIVGPRAPWTVLLRAVVVLLLAFTLMALREQSSAYYLLWFFVLVTVYPLVLPRRASLALVVGVPFVYLLLVPFGAADGPVPVAVLRAVSLALMGAFVHAAAVAYRTAVADRDGALALLDAYADATPVGLGFWDLGLRLRRINAALASLTGLPPAAHLGRAPDGLPDPAPALAHHLGRVVASGEPVQDVEVSVGATVWNASYFPVVTGSRVVGVGGVVIDVTAQRQAAAALAHSATHDALTGLPNRVLFGDRLGVALERAAREGASVAVLFCDVDRFKVVNDSLGHAAGDELLRVVAERLTRVVRPGDTVARLGGDEFAVLATAVPDVAAAQSAGERICAVLREPMRVGDRLLISTMSVGVTVCGPGEQDVAGLLRDADVAMYQAKDAGRDQAAVFDTSLRSRAGERLEFQGALRRAVEHGELTVAYQPVLALRGGAAGADGPGPQDVVGVEALARWHRDGHGDVPPGVFIPTAEDLGLIGALGEHVLRRACTDVLRWREATGRPLTVAVNLSARQLAAEDCAEMVAAVLGEVGLPAAALQLEITESVLMVDVERSLHRLGELRALGVGIAVDDFGTGYSSLAYLRDLPVDLLKIDRSFTARQPADEAMFAFIVDLARAIGATTVVEGVETAAQLDLVTRAGCDLAQGYHLSRPLTPEAAAVYLGAVPRA